MLGSLFRKKGYREGSSRIHQLGLSCSPLPPLGYGGIETVVANLTMGLVDEGIPVTCYAPPPFAIKGADYYQTTAETTVGPKESGVANTAEHLEKIAEGLNNLWRPGDIIHLHHFQHYQVLGKRLRKEIISKGIFVETAHWTRVTLNACIAYPSFSLSDHIGRPGRVIPHGIDLSVFRDGAPNSNNYLFYAGRLTKDKGVAIAAEAAKEYGIEFRVAGPIPDKEYAATFLDDVNYIGELTATELVSQYQGALALVYMTQYVEPFGLAVVESMACGTPVLTTGNGGTGETMVEGKTGFLCRTKEDILSKIDAVGALSKDDCVERAGHYSIEAMTRNYMEFYKELVPELS